MPLTILKVIPYKDTLAIEFEVERGYPDTFSRTWAELEAMLEAKERTPEEFQRECVALASLLLKQKVEVNKASDPASSSLLDLAREGVKD